MIVSKKLTKIVTAVLFIFGSLQVSAANSAVDDSSITKDVKDKIQANEATATSNITVKTKEGVVELSGNVKTENEASIAIESANSVAGVKSVNTEHLMVQNSSQPYKDAYITAKVKGAFIREKLFGEQEIPVTEINVETKEGVVYLTGKVDNMAQEQEAIKLAKDIKDVKSVESKIEVKK